MSTSETFRSELDKARAELRRITADVRDAAHEAKGAFAEQVDSLVAHADLTLDKIDDEIARLEASGKTSGAEMRQNAESNMQDLEARRDQLRQKAAALRVSGRDRLEKATAEFDKVMTELTEKRNAGMVGIN